MKQMEPIARQFFRFSRWIGATPLGNGNINDTYRIEFQEDEQVFVFVLQRLNHLVFQRPWAVAENINRVTSFLKQSEFPLACPAPLPTLQGKFLYESADGNFWRVFPYLPDTVTPDGAGNPKVAYQAAKAYGAFARALRNFPAASLEETIAGFHDTDRRWEAFLQVLQSDPAGRVGGSAPEIEAMYQAKPLFDRISALKKSGELPLRVTHNDTKAGNILFDAAMQQAVAVIDLDTVMPGVILSDFGDMVRTFVPDKTEDDPGSLFLRMDMLEALEAGFLSETESMLNRAEKQNLLASGAWITGEQALRFLTDWLAGDIYYKVRFPEHNLVRARNQLDLFQKLMALPEIGL